MKMPIVPGVMTPSGIEQGLSLGCQLLKFFPAEASGGIKMLKALGGPFGGISFMPTGGISTDNVCDYLRLPNVIATPHIGGLVPQAIAHQALETTRQAAAILEGKAPAGAVNPEHATRLRP